jgi:ubiquinone/menaquinone biosynthesis C-methylase UbiE
MGCSQLAKSFGVDMVEEMLAKAQRKAETLGLANLDFRLGRADASPVPNRKADAVTVDRRWSQLFWAFLSPS